MPPNRSAVSDRTLRKWLQCFLIVGISWRVIRYALAMPLWGDEAYLGLNIIGRSYADLLKPLDFFQVAPILFLWAQHAVCETLGMSEYSVRLLPFVASVAGLVFFHRWAALVVSPLPATIATAIVAVSYYIVHLSTEFKPYSFDFLAALLLLLPATRFLLHRRSYHLAFLLLVLPFALAMSYPAVFVAAGIAPALLLPWRRLPRSAKSLSLAYLLLLLLTFYFLLTHVAEKQYDRTSGYMINYWRDAFPPLKVTEFVAWLWKTHAGIFFAYPAGGKNSASIVSFLLSLIGFAGFCRSANRALTVVLVAPFAFTFIAAVFRHYPYGGDPRVSQHLAPMICLLIGLGVSTLIERFATTDRRRRQATAAVFVALIVVATCGLTGNLVYPYHNESAEQARDSVRQLFRRAGPKETILVLQAPSQVPATVLWYLHEHDSRITWRDLQCSTIKPSRLCDAGESGIWAINCVDARSQSLPGRLENLLGMHLAELHTQRLRSIPHRQLPQGIWQCMHFLPRARDPQPASRSAQTK